MPLMSLKSLVYYFGFFVSFVEISIEIKIVVELIISFLLNKILSWPMATLVPLLEQVETQNSKLPDLQ